MMSTDVRNARRTAVERAVKASHLRGAAIDAEVARRVSARNRGTEMYYSADDLFVRVYAVESFAHGAMATIDHPLCGRTLVPASKLLPIS